MWAKLVQWERINNRGRCQKSYAILGASCFKIEDKIHDAIDAKIVRLLHPPLLNIIAELKHLTWTNLHEWERARSQHDLFPLHFFFFHILSTHFFINQKLRAIQEGFEFFHGIPKWTNSQLHLTVCCNEYSIFSRRFRRKSTTLSG